MDAMKKLKRDAFLCGGLGALSAIAILLCHLALTDIAHGEGDLALEWRMLQVGSAAIILFHGAVLLTLFHLYAFFKRGRGESEASAPGAAIRE
jgi:hypothetical protein